MKTIKKIFKAIADKASLAIARFNNSLALRTTTFLAVTGTLTVSSFCSQVEVAEVGSNVISNIRQILYDKGIPALAVALAVCFLSMATCNKVDDIVARLKLAGMILLAGILIYVFCKDEKTVVNTINQLVDGGTP